MNKEEALFCYQCEQTAKGTGCTVATLTNVDFDELPLSLIISWYEQKAVCGLLALFHLSIKDIRLQPSLPAFLTPNVLDTLVNSFDIKPIATADEDLEAILG